MADTGYSGTPLIKKLGIKPEMKVLVMHKPEAYFEWLGADIAKQFVEAKEIPGFIHLFAASTAAFKKEMVSVLKFCKKNTSIVVWVSWYKKSSGIVTDLSENFIREFTLQNNLIDIKVCAVSNEWSGLKLVVPVAKKMISFWQRKRYGKTAALTQNTFCFYGTVMSINHGFNIA